MVRLITALECAILQDLLVDSLEVIEENGEEALAKRLQEMIALISNLKQEQIENVID